MFSIFASSRRDHSFWSTFCLVEYCNVECQLDNSIGKRGLNYMLEPGQIFETVTRVNKPIFTSVSILSFFELPLFPKPFYFSFESFVLLWSAFCVSTFLEVIFQRFSCQKLRNLFKWMRLLVWWYKNRRWLEINNENLTTWQCWKNGIKNVDPNRKCNLWRSV